MACVMASVSPLFASIKSISYHCSRFFLFLSQCMKLLRAQFLFTFCALYIYAQFTFAQESSDTSQCPTKDISDLIRKNKPGKQKAQKNYFIFVTPVIGSSPATGFIFGLAGQITFKGPLPDD